MRWAGRSPFLIVVVAVLFAAVFTVRWFSTVGAGEAITLLYTIPVALLAARFGLRAGLVAGLLAFALTLFWMLVRDTPVGILGMVARSLTFLVAGAAIGLGADEVSRITEERRRAAEQSRQDLQRSHEAERRSANLQVLARSLSRAATLEEVGAAYVTDGLPLLGALHGGVYLVDRRAGALSLIALSRAFDSSEHWARIPLGARTPPTDAVRTASSSFLDTAAAMDEAYPHLADFRATSGHEAWAACPLVSNQEDPEAADRRVRGVFAAAFTTPQSFDEAQRSLFVEMTARLSEAIERAILLEEASAERARAQTAEQRASLLAGLGMLSGSADTGERMRQLLGVLVPAFADMGTIELVRGRTLELLAAAHADPGSLPVLEQIRRAHGSDGGRGLGHSVFGDRPALDPRTPDGVLELVATAPGDEFAFEILRPTSYLAVPLRARGEVIGGLLLVQGEASGRRFDVEDLGLARTIAGRVALALDNARLYDQQRDIVTALQHALLPGELPRVPGVEACARYRPGIAALEVGGDWYDVIELPDSRVGIVLGDVVGRGVAAAATMGQLRSGVAAITPHATGPAEVLTRLDRFAAGVSGAELATVLYAEFDPRSGWLRYSCAGHPPPLLIVGDRTGFLDGGRGVPLATGSVEERSESRVRIETAGTLIAYSDGLVELRGVDIDVRLSQLRHTAASFVGRPLDDLCTGLLDGMHGDSPPGDDVALICLTLRRLQGEPYRRRTAARREQLVELRRDVRAWATGLGADDDAVADLLLATGEACANAIEHAYDGDPRGVGHLELALDAFADGAIRAEVRDSGVWRPRAASAAFRGRGLALIRAATSTAEIVQGEDGTLVSMWLPCAFRTEPEPVGAADV